MRFPHNFPELGEGDRLMVCKHLFEAVRDRQPQPETHWRRGSDSFKREDGTNTGAVAACLLCVLCRDTLHPKEVDYIEFLSLKGKLYLADGMIAPIVERTDPDSSTPQPEAKP